MNVISTWHSICEILTFTYSMIRNYFLSTLRILYKEKLYTLINSIGLAIGLATCFLIFSWVRFETSFDSFPGSDQVYRITTQWDDGEGEGIASTYPMVKTRVLTQFPEVEKSTRLFNQGFLGTKTRIALADRVFVDETFYYADSTFFEVFPLKFLYGDSKTSLAAPNGVVITEGTARKFFGSENPMGKMIRVDGSRDFEISGVVEDIPANRHFHFDVLASMLAHPWIANAENNVWSGVVFHTYVKLKVGASASELQSKIAQFMDRFPNDPDQLGKKLDLQLQAIQRIHLDSHKKFELQANGDRTYVYLFSTIALLVLAIAIINYTNLATARHTQRVKEVGVRKVLGASQKQLVQQFLMESMMVAALAFVVAFLFVEVARPFLQVISDHESFSTSFGEPRVLLAATLLTLVVGLLTGISPALALASFRPVKLLKSTVLASGKGFTVRKALVISQFTISTVLTICTAITYIQVTFLNNAKLGYELDHTLVLNIGFPEVKEKYAILKTQLQANPAVLGATASSQLPTDIQTGENIDWSSTETLGVNCVSTDADFFRVMGISIEGTPELSTLIPNDSVNRFVLNESALQSIGWEKRDALTREIKIRHGNMKPGKVVGIASDFHFQSLHHTIGPLAIEFNPDSYEYLLVKIRPDHVKETLSFISEEWKKIAGGIPFDYSFLDQDYDRLYKSEQRSNALFITFSSVAMIISLLGLFGLSSFSVERRTKEIGLRKILGAERFQIVSLVSKDFLWLLVIAFVIALPIGYYFMTSWLSGFAFRATIGAEVFIFGGTLNIVLGLAILSYHSFRISKTNPVDTLRYE